MELPATGGVPAKQLTWCTNTHPSGGGEALLDLLEGSVAAVRHHLAPPGSLGLGLWLPAPLVTELAGSGAMQERVAGALASGSLHLLTANIFPMGVFHSRPVKEQVYRPDWGTEERLAYTLMAMAVAADLVPEGTVLPLSTLPVGLAGDREAQRRVAVPRLAEAALAAARLHAERGVEVLLCLEPEPGCVFERGDDLVRWLAEPPPEVRSRPGAAAAWRRHLALCLDTCHAAVMAEEPAATLSLAASLGVRVGKVQLASALVVEAPTPEGMAALEPFEDGVYCHQVAFHDDQGRPSRLLPDLGPARSALAAGARPGRMVVHFHLPLHWGGGKGLAGSAARDLPPLLARRELLPPVLEVETYTWSVLPSFLAGEGTIEAGVAAELEWVGAYFR